MMKPIKIAITGGIGSGKSTAGKIISELGFKVYDADSIYNDLIKDEKIALLLSAAIGVDLKACKDGKKSFDKEAVANKVFSDENSLKVLNKLSHELVYNEIEKICCSNIDEDILFFEIPLLFESEKDNEFDYVIVIMRNKQTRIESVMQRNNLTQKQVIDRMRNQIDYDNLTRLKHTFIYNDSDEVSLRVKLEEFIKSIEK